MLLVSRFTEHQFYLSGKSEPSWLKFNKPPSVKSYNNYERNGSKSFFINYSIRSVNIINIDTLPVTTVNKNRRFLAVTKFYQLEFIPCLVMHEWSSPIRYIKHHIQRSSRTTKHELKPSLQTCFFKDAILTCSIKCE